MLEMMTPSSSGTRMHHFDDEDSPQPSRDDGLTVEEMISLHVGEIGKAQVRHFVLSSVAWVPAVFMTLMSVFTERDPAWRCVAPDGCEDRAFCSLNDKDWEWVSKSASIRSEWNLVCGDAWKVSSADSMFFAGFFFGAGLIGQLADLRGRKPAMYLSLVIGGLGSVISAAVSSFWPYFWSKSIIGFGCGGVGVASFVLSIEPLGAKWRSRLGIATQYWWASGIVLMSCVAMGITEWRAYTIFVVVSVALYCVVSAPLLKESPKWLLIAGKSDKALEVLTALAKGNGQDIPLQGLPRLKRPTTSSASSKMSIAAVLPYPALRIRLFAMAFVFFVNSAVYYGLSLNVGSLGGSIYLNNILSALVEMVSYAFAQVSVEKVGRKHTLMFLLTVAGFGCLVSGFSTGGARIAVALVGRFGIAASFNMIFLYTTELFPTVVRSAALGTCSLVARLGGIIAPQIILLQTVSPSLPFIVFGWASAAACFATTFLAETKGVIMQDTIEGADRQAQATSGSNFYQLSAEDFEEDEETLTNRDY